MKRNSIVILFVLFCKVALSQSYQDDAALWFYLGFDKKLNDKFTLSLRQKNRVNDNVSTYHLGYLDAGLEYSINKNFKISANYVFGFRRADDYTFEDRHRAYLAFFAKRKLNKWTLIYRNRFQVQWRNPYSNEEGTVIRFYDRNKCTLKYNLNKWLDFYLSEELYLPLYQAQNKGFDRSRSYLGANYSFNKKSSFDLSFGYQHELNAFNVTNRIFIYSMGYVYSF